MSNDYILPQRWLSATSRTMAVTLGAYAATSLITMALPLLLIRLGITRLEAVIAASLASFLFFTLLAISVFLAPSATQAWGRLLLASLPAFILLWLLR